jgi:hypothetical protein
MLQDQCSALRKLYWGQHPRARGYFGADMGAETRIPYARLRTQQWDDPGETSRSPRLARALKPALSLDIL